MFEIIHAPKDRYGVPIDIGDTVEVYGDTFQDNAKSCKVRSEKEDGMNIKEKLELLSASEGFIVSEYDGRYSVEFRESGRMEHPILAYYDGWDWTYSITETYNCGRQRIEIDMAGLMKIKRFCEMLVMGA